MSVEANVVAAEVLDGGVLLRVFLPMRPQFQPKDDPSEEETKRLTEANAAAAEYNVKVLRSIRFGTLVWPEAK